ncbi:hypothetical protein AA313_de0204237 [Arthrobotrys entomopaga]|nr:hypothetical protein AA313_de0204237 [Arthrobotrys entomopaga]
MGRLFSRRNLLLLLVEEQSTKVTEPHIGQSDKRMRTGSQSSYWILIDGVHQVDNGLRCVLVEHVDRAFLEWSQRTAEFLVFREDEGTVSGTFRLVVLDHAVDCTVELLLVELGFGRFRGHIWSCNMFFVTGGGWLFGTLLSSRIGVSTECMMGRSGTSDCGRGKFA